MCLVLIEITGASFSVGEEVIPVLGEPEGFLNREIVV
jgi:hypothetical protein